MDKKEILDILDNAKDDRGAVPMRLVRQALDKLSAIQPISSVQPKPDCVSRQAAIDDVCKMMYECFGADEEELDAIEVTLHEIPAVQPDHNADVGKKAEGDCISRRAAIDALAEQMPTSYTPDGSHPADKGIFAAQEIYADCIKTIEQLPAVQPELDCISRKAAIDDVCKMMCECFGADDEELDTIEVTLRELPAVQPEIIRCKDCKYMIDTGDDLMCDNAKGWVVATASDFGCVLAERRTDG